MNTLRARLAILLVAAIITVVVLASGVAVSVIGLPGEQRYFELAAPQIIAFAKDVESQTDPLAAPAASGQWYTLRPNPLPGSDPDLTATLSNALSSIGSSLVPKVTRGPDGEGLLISVPIADRGWLIVPMAALNKPPGATMALASWMLIIVAGATTVALGAAFKMTQPLRLIERVAASVGADGVLPVIPETGPAELRTTAHALNQLSSRLKLAMESRMRLVAAAGHDLRTPMTRMRLRAEFVADEEERAAWLHDLDELAQIADSAIGLVREEVEIPSLKPMYLDALLVSVVMEQSDLGRSIKMESIEPVVVNAAPWSLKRALSNLVVNAATHGGGATVALTRTGGKAIVTIIDGGRGIPPDLIERVFEPFFQVDPARRRSFGGAGLGLAIAKEIISRYGGTITLENRPEGGLRQTITLPEIDNGETGNRKATL